MPLLVPISRMCQVNFKCWMITSSIYLIFCTFQRTFIHIIKSCPHNNLQKYIGKETVAQVYAKGYKLKTQVLAVLNLYFNVILHLPQRHFVNYFLYHKVGGLNNRNILSHSLGGWKSKVIVKAGLVPSEGCEGGICPGLSVSSLHVSSQHLPSVCVVQSTFLVIRTPVKLDSGPNILQHDFILTNYICSKLVCK